MDRPHSSRRNAVVQRGACVRGLAEEVDVLVDEPEILEDVADDGELGVVDPPEGDRGKHRRDDVGKQDDRADDRLERHVVVQEQREIEAKAEFQDGRDRRVEDRVEDDEPEDAVVEQRDVVLEPDEEARPADLGVGESQPYTEAERVCQERQQQDRRGRHADDGKDIPIVEQVDKRLADDAVRPV